MFRSVATKTLYDLRRGLLGWTGGLVALVAMMVAVYPSIRGNDSLEKLIDDYPEALKAFISFGGTVDYTSPAGFLGSELFSLMIPLLLIVAAIGAGARAVAGEEEAGTLDLLLANPISRRRLVLEKLAALVAEVGFLGVVLWLSLAIGARAAGMEISLGDLAAATTVAVLLALVYGTLALFVGSASGRRSAAIAAPAALAVAAYFANALGALVGALEPAQKASPFYHYAVGDSLRRGLAWDHAGLLLLLAAVFALLAAPALARRDLR